MTDRHAILGKYRATIRNVSRSYDGLFVHKCLFKDHAFIRKSELNFFFYKSIFFKSCDEWRRWKTNLVAVVTSQIVHSYYWHLSYATIDNKMNKLNESSFCRSESSNLKININIKERKKKTETKTFRLLNALVNATCTMLMLMRLLNTISNAPRTKRLQMRLYNVNDERQSKD